MGADKHRQGSDFIIGNEGEEGVGVNFPTTNLCDEIVAVRSEQIQTASAVQLAGLMRAERVKDLAQEVQLLQITKQHLLLLLLLMGFQVQLSLEIWTPSKGSRDGANDTQAFTYRCLNHRVILTKNPK